MVSQALAAFVPSDSDPFDSRKAAHLLRRAGFGASPAAVRKAVDQGLEASVDTLFDEAADEERAFQTTFAAVNGGLMNFSESEGIQAWWAYQMARTQVPLREKLALFWHGHFATNEEKVGDQHLMHSQIETFRRLAWGNFRELTLSVARDPAMLVWLDGESSTKDHPNENFARELLELFTCGIGHYGEKDVREAARAFTGWHREEAAFVFHPDDHDFGRKHFLGKSGKFDGTDVIDILMQQPATLRFLARKLLRFFAAPAPALEVVEEAAALLDRTRLDIKWFLRELFLSRYFYSAECYRTRLSSPAEYVIGTVRTLEATWPANEAVAMMTAMGQELLAPPNVKGWDGEEKWINSSTWNARLRFATTISQLVPESAYSPGFDMTKLVAQQTKDPDKVVDALADALLQGELPADTRRSFTEFLVTSEEGRKPEMFREDDEFRNAKTRELLGMIVSLPEYQAY